MLEPFRPFAAKFVETTFEEYSRKHERSLTAPSTQSREHKKVDIRKLYPHKHSVEEQKSRTESFLRLKDRVLKQREQIRRADHKHEQRKAIKLKEELEKSIYAKTIRQQFEMQLREMADALPAKSVQVNTQPFQLKQRGPKTSNRSRTDNFFSLTAPKMESRYTTDHPSKIMMSASKVHSKTRQFRKSS